jgi:hypothetical protein
MPRCSSNEEMVNGESNWRSSPLMMRFIYGELSFQTHGSLQIGPAIFVVR